MKRALLLVALLWWWPVPTFAQVPPPPKDLTDQLEEAVGGEKNDLPIQVYYNREEQMQPWSHPDDSDTELRRDMFTLLGLNAGAGILLMKMRRSG